MSLPHLSAYLQEFPQWNSIQPQHSAHSAPSTGTWPSTCPPWAPALLISPVAFLASCAHFSEFSWHLKFLSHGNSCNCNKCITHLAVVYIFFSFSCLLCMWYDHENTRNIWMQKSLTNCVKGLFIPRNLILLIKSSRKSKVIHFAFWTNFAHFIHTLFYVCVPFLKSIFPLVLPFMGINFLWLELTL